MNNHTSDKIKNNLTYFTHLKSQMEKHELRAKSFHFRRNLLERQKVANYTNELDRIMGELSKTVLHGQTRVKLIERSIYEN